MSGLGAGWVSMHVWLPLQTVWLMKTAMGWNVWQEARAMKRISKKAFIIFLIFINHGLTI